MKDDSQQTTSVWMATAETPSEPTLQQDIRTDVCIVGAGIAGITTGYLLSLEGRSVIVLDDGAIGGGMTGRYDGAPDKRIRRPVCRDGENLDWNSTEKTWDCPCHGSRYDALGHVYQGPANSDLEPAEQGRTAKSQSS